MLTKKTQGEDRKSLSAMFRKEIFQLTAEQSLKSVVREFFGDIEEALTERGARFEQVAVALIRIGKVPDPGDPASMKKLASTIKKYTQDMRIEQKAEILRLLASGHSLAEACAEIGTDAARWRARFEEERRKRTRQDPGLDWLDAHGDDEDDARGGRPAARPKAERRQDLAANVDKRRAERTPPANVGTARGRARLPAPSVDTGYGENERRSPSANGDKDDLPDPSELDFGEQEVAPATRAAAPMSRTRDEEGFDPADLNIPDFTEMKYPPNKVLKKAAAAA